MVLLQRQLYTKEKTETAKFKWKNGQPCIVEENNFLEQRLKIQDSMDGVREHSTRMKG